MTTGIFEVTQASNSVQNDQVDPRLPQLTFAVREVPREQILLEELFP